MNKIKTLTLIALFLLSTMLVSAAKVQPGVFHTRNSLDNVYRVGGTENVNQRTVELDLKSVKHVYYRSRSIQDSVSAVLIKFSKSGRYERSFMSIEEVSTTNAYKQYKVKTDLPGSEVKQIVMRLKIKDTSHTDGKVVINGKIVHSDVFRTTNGLIYQISTNQVPRTIKLY
jgi:hypothetical protein